MRAPTRGNLNYAFNNVSHFPNPIFPRPPRHATQRVFPGGDGNVTMILITLLECKWKAHTDPDT